MVPSVASEKIPSDSTGDRSRDLPTSSAGRKTISSLVWRSVVWYKYTDCYTLKTETIRCAVNMGVMRCSLKTGIVKFSETMTKFYQNARCNIGEAVFYVVLNLNTGVTVSNSNNWNAWRRYASGWSKWFCDFFEASLSVVKFSVKVKVNFSLSTP
jgi:hypothetical protein